MSAGKTIFNRNIRFDNKYYTRLLIVFVIMIVAFMVIIAITTYAGNYKTIERNFHAKNTDLFSIYTRNLENNLDIVLTINSQLMSDNNLIKYIAFNKESSYDTQLITKNFISSLYNRIYLLNYVKDIGVYLAENDRIIHDKGAEDGKSFFNGFSFEGLNYNQFYEILNKKQRYDAITLKSSDSNSDHLICIVRNSMLNYNKLSIITYLDAEKLIVKNPDEEGDLFVYNESAGFIASTGEHEAVTPDVLERIKTLQSGSLPLSSNGQDYYLYFGYYKPLQWYYGYLAPQKSMLSQISAYTLWTATLIALLIILGIFLAFFLTGVAYKPVRLILSRMQLEKISGKKAKLDEFELISQNFFDVQQNNTILHKRLEDSKAIIKSGFLKDLLYGYNSKNPGDEPENSLDIRFERKFFQVVVLDIDDLAMIEHKNAGEVTALLQQDILSTTGYYFRKIYPCEVLESGFGKIAVILNYDSENAELPGIIREIQTLAKETLNITITAAIGRKYESIRDISVSFKEAMQAMEYKYALGRGKILTMTDIEVFSNDTFYYPLEKERFIINATVNGDFSAVKNAVLEVIEDNFDKRALKPEVRYHLLSAMAGTLIRIFHTISRTPQDVFGKNYDIYHEIRDFNDITLFRNKVVNIYRALCEKALEAQDRAEDKLKRKMFDCIDNNYHRYDFSLNEMAGQFNLSATYFSDLFKERTGENFIDYLIGYRLRKARELMAGTNLKINEIAGRVGYNNTTSFIRAFKKYEGVSPGKFKEIHF